MGRRASVTDVARRAGVSVGTVSHALNHPEKLTSETLERVNQAIVDLGYIRSGSARQLRAGRSNTVGLLLQDISNPFYVEAARSLEASLAPRDIALLLCSVDDAAKRERALRTVLEHEVRAVVIAAETGAAEMAERLQQQGVPVVLMDAVDGPPGVSWVGVDDVDGAAQAVGHLLATGHERIAMLSGPLSVVQAAQRWAGAQEACRRRGLDPDGVLSLVEARSFTADGGARAMESALDIPGLTAVFTANDVMALGAMRLLRQRGLTIPQDMAIVGYDDIPIAAELITPLTSVRQPLADMGRQVADLVLGDGQVRQVLLPATLAVRATAP